jgi:hypothetical protein
VEEESVGGVTVMDHPENKPVQRKWRMRAPVSKADKDAIREFNRFVARRSHLIGELKQADVQLQEAFSTLQRRGQVDEDSPSTDSAG